MTDHDMLSVERRLDAEAAALIAWCDDPNIGGRELEEVGKGETLDVRALRRQVDGQPVGIAPDRERASGLDGADTAAVGAEALLEHHVGLGEQRLDLGVVRGDLVRFGATGAAGAKNLVVVPVVIDPRCAVAQRSLGAGDDGERLVIDLHGGRGVLGDILVLRQDRGERLAVPIHLVHRERPVLAIGRGKGGDQHRDLLTLNLFREFGAGDRADHARHRKRRLQSDLPDLGVRVTGADEAEMQAIGHAEIGKVFALAREQTQILAPLQGAADPAGLAGCGHGALSVSAGGGSGFTP